jgi:hypothetical protein
MVNQAVLDDVQPGSLAARMGAPSVAWNDRPEQRANFAASLDRTRQQKATDSGVAGTFATAKLNGVDDATARKLAGAYRHNTNAVAGGAAPVPLAPNMAGWNSAPSPTPTLPAPGGAAAGAVGRHAAPMAPTPYPSAPANANYQRPVPSPATYTPDQIKVQSAQHDKNVAIAQQAFTTVQRTRHPDPKLVADAKAKLDKATQDRDAFLTQQSGTNSYYGGGLLPGQPGAGITHSAPTPLPPGIAAPGSPGTAAGPEGITLDPATAQQMWHNHLDANPNQAIGDTRTQFVGTMGKYGYSPEVVNGLLDQWHNDGTLLPQAPPSPTPQWSPTVEPRDGRGGIYQNPQGQRIVVDANGQRIGVPLGPGLPSSPSPTPTLPVPSRAPLPRSNAAAVQPSTQPAATQPASGDQSLHRPGPGQVKAKLPNGRIVIMNKADGSVVREVGQ